MNLWLLPKTARIGDTEYPIHTDFRDILEIFTWLGDESLPEFIRWQVALALFYEGQIPREDQTQAIRFLGDFISCGQPGAPGPKLLDWQLDAELIISDVNRVAGREIREVPYIHWWTFLGWFQAIGEGQLSTVVAIRDKLRRGKKLEAWERDYYRSHRSRVELKKARTPAEEAEIARLNALLEGKMQNA